MVRAANQANTLLTLPPRGVLRAWPYCCASTTKTSHPHAQLPHTHVLELKHSLGEYGSSPNASVVRADSASNVLLTFPDWGVLRAWPYSCPSTGGRVARTIADVASGSSPRLQSDPKREERVRQEVREGLGDGGLGLYVVGENRRCVSTGGRVARAGGEVGSGLRVIAMPGKE